MYNQGDIIVNLMNRGSHELPLKYGDICEVFRSSVEEVDLIRGGFECKGALVERIRIATKEEKQAYHEGIINIKNIKTPHYEIF